MKAMSDKFAARKSRCIFTGVALGKTRGNSCGYDSLHPQSEVPLLPDAAAMTPPQTQPEPPDPRIHTLTVDAGRTGLGHLRENCHVVTPTWLHKPKYALQYPAQSGVYDIHTGLDPGIQSIGVDAGQTELRKLALARRGE